MRRRAKPAKAKVETRRPVARKSPKNEVSKRRDLEKRLAESLEREKATSGILRVIARSGTDVQPVFATILEHAAGLCGAQLALLWLHEGGEQFRLAAAHGARPDYREWLIEKPQHFGRPFFRPNGPWRVGHIEDVRETEPYRSGDPLWVRTVDQEGMRTLLGVPLVQDGRLIGSIAVYRRELQRFTDAHIELIKTFADQAAIAIENARLFRDLAEALEQQTATSEILRVISQSPTDVQPVFDTIVRTAVRLCDGLFSALYQFDGELIHLVAQHNFTPEALVEAHRVFPARPTRALMPGRAILERAVVHIPDVELDPEFQYQALSRAVGLRSGLWVPMLREGTPIGVIAVARAEAGPFSDNEIELLKTFADQAVIAVENVRLFKELEARNRDLMATSEILQVISRSPTDVQPVFDTIAERAMRLCDAAFGAVLMFDGALIHLNALANVNPEGIDSLRQAFPVAPSQGSVAGRVILAGDVVQIPDVLGDPEYQLIGPAQVAKYRCILGVPMLHRGRAIGAIHVTRPEPGTFSEEQIQLLKTFADQAVIAIENVRLFTELQASNRELTTALDTQTATSDILRVISRSQTNVQPVFDAIVASAVRLLGAYTGALTRIAGDQVVIGALTGHDAASDAAVRAAFPQSLQSEGTHAQTIRDRVPLNIADFQTDPRLSEALRASAAIRGYRSLVVVPMLLHDEAIGAIGVTRRDTGGFTDDEIALLKTFADQAVIAIENARLLSELQQKNEALTQAHAQVSEALEQQMATAEILRVISQSQTDVQPVFDTIVRSAVRLCDGLFSALFQFDGELIHPVAHHNFTPEALGGLHRTYPTRPTRALGTGRAILERAVAHIPDFEVDPEFPHRALSRAIGYRSSLSVPMLREGVPIGVIWVARAEVGRFSDSETELLKTFADQAVIAVENVRLFKELEARTGELTQSVEKLTALGEVSQALSSTLDVETVLDTIVSHASQLAGAAGCSIYEYDEAAEQFELRATHNDDAEFVEALRAAPLRKGEGLMGRAAEMREPIQIPDITQPGAYQSSVRDTLIRFGYRALLSVPLLREDQIIGSLSFNRKAPGEFPPEVIEVLKTFATQSALAIQNARLFREIADKSRQLEAASRHKSEFLANMSHELRTPLNAIIGFSEVLVDRMFGELNEKQDEYLKDIYASGQHLLSLINDILDLSKIEAGRMELEVTDFDLPSAIDNALTLVRERATRRGITLGRSIDKRLGMIGGDERKVKQVLLNLLSNALKFTPEGGGIDVGARVHDEVAEVSVTDTGVGIAPEDQEAVFEEFRQVGTADKKVEGTGLGLALSRKFIELHGGRIWVTSTVGLGSTFTFTLPLRR